MQGSNPAGVIFSINMFFMQDDAMFDKWLPMIEYQNNVNNPQLKHSVLWSWSLQKHLLTSFSISVRDTTLRENIQVPASVQPSSQLYGM